MKKVALIGAVLVVILFNANVVMGQGFLKDSLLYVEIGARYQSWLNTELEGGKLSIDSLLIEDDRITLALTVPRSEDWYNFRQEFLRETNLNLCEVLYYKMLFLFELEEQEAAIEILPKEIIKEKPLQVWMYYKEGEKSWRLMELVPKAVEDTIEILEERLAGFNIIQGRNSLGYTKQLLDQFVKLKFSTSRHPNVKIEPKTTDNRNTAHYIIRTIKREVLNEGDYFERLDLVFLLHQKDNRVIIKYIINGKYRQAYLVDFYLTGFYDMSNSKQFASDFDIYCSILVEEINDFLMD